MIRRISIMAALVLFSLGIGFGLVFLFAPVKEPPVDSDAEELPLAVQAAVGTPDTGEDAGEPDEDDQGEAPPELPPGPTPDGVFQEGPPLYYKCWDANGDAHKGEECDRLRLFEKRFATRLYALDECRREKAGEDSEGMLSLAVQVDLGAKEVKAWSGPSSEIEEASKLGSCARRKLAGLPLYEVTGKFEKYRLFFTVRFEDAKELAKKLEDKKRRARKATVAMDKVNVRYEPEDGMVMGRLGSGDEVHLVKRKGDWCQIITPADREGWIICEALGK